MALAVITALAALVFARAFWQAAKNSRQQKIPDELALLMRLTPKTKVQRHAYLKALRKRREEFSDRLIGDDENS